MEIFDSFVEAGRQMAKKDRGAYYEALIDFIAYGEEPEGLTGAPAAVMCAIMPVLRNSRARAEAGARGGRSRKAKAQATDEANTQANTQAKAEAKPQAKAKAKRETNTVPNSNSNSNTKTSKNDVSVLLEANPEAPLPAPPLMIAAMAAAPFEPPTPAQVRDYAQASGMRGFDYAAFVDHYAAQGWRRANGLPVADWKPLCRNWAARQAEYDARDGRAAADERERTVSRLDAEHGIDWSGMAAGVAK